MDAYDLVITKIQCGRGTPAQQLVQSGRQIQWLERDAWLPCEPESCSSVDFLVDKRSVPAVTSHYGGRKPFQPLERVGAFG